MATAAPEAKRQRLNAYGGLPHPMPAQHPPDVSAPYPHHAVLPPPVPPAAAYHEHDHREPAAVAYHHHPGSGYVTPLEGIAPAYPPDPAFARPAGTPIKTGSPAEGPHAPLRNGGLPAAAAEGTLAMSAHPVEHAAAPPAAPFADHHPPPLDTTGHHAVAVPNPDGVTPIHSAGYTPPDAPMGSRDSYYLSTSLLTTYPPRRKAIRAAQACDACRQRKAKCDEGRPSCGFCKEAVQPCVYREVPPPKQDRTLLQILHKLDKLDKLDRLEAEMDEIRHFMRTTGAHGGGAVERLRAADAAHGPDARRASLSGAIPATATAAVARPSPVEMPPVRSQEKMVKEEIKPDESGGQGELSIPIEHTTAAHKLLRWPSIRKLVEQVTQNEHYVMQCEEKRGILRVWGRGEGVDAPTGGPSGSWTTPHEYPSRDDPALYPPDGLWGAGLSRGGAVDVRRPAVESLGGLNPDGSLKLDAWTLNRLLASYMTNIHIMHPILDPVRISHMVMALGERYPPPPGHGPSPSPYVAHPTGANDLRRESAPSLVAGIKRKHSATVMPGHSPAPSYPTFWGSYPPPEHSITSALVLLVAALGKICEHKDYLPGPAPAFPSDVERPGLLTDLSPQRRTDSPPTPVKHSPGSSQSSGHGSAASPQDMSRMAYSARRSSLDAGSPIDRGPLPINADVIPGLAYYAYATEILGNLHGGNELAHVQAGLLAGLYAGQLGRVLESWKWINWACTGCQVLVKRTTFDERSVEGQVVKIADERTNPIIVAFWTCLQLESDILAELDLPPSGISRHEEVFPFPMPQTTLVWTYYSAQIALRKLLNRVHYLLYKPGHDTTHSGLSVRKLKILEEQLSSWRKLLPVDLRWEDGDPPPSDINAARLRAKYYGARYIIFRPFLHHCIHPTGQWESRLGLPEDATSTESGPASSMHGSPPRIAVSQLFGSVARPPGVSAETMPPPPPTVNSDPVDAEVLDACQQCIRAAMQSTAAFHGINHRPIVTNIFGTAHAQFGNLLVLQVASRHHALREYVPRDKLFHLLNKTITFLRNLSPISPTLKFDAEILERSMRSPHHHHHPHHHPMSSSFSSSTESTYGR